MFIFAHNEDTSFLYVGKIGRPRELGYIKPNPVKVTVFIIPMCFFSRTLINIVISLLG